MSMRGRGGYDSQGSRGGYGRGRGGYESQGSRGGLRGRGGSYESGSASFRGGRRGDSFDHAQGGRLAESQRPGGYRGSEFRGGGRGQGAAPVHDRVGPIDVYANHFAVSLSDSCPTVYEHLVEITNDRDERMVVEVRRHVLSEFLKDTDEPVGPYAYDGDRILVTQKKISKSGERKCGPGKIRINITPQGAGLKFRDHAKAAEGDGAVDKKREQLLDIVIKAAANVHSEQAGASRFLSKVGEGKFIDLSTISPPHKRREASNLNLWMGHFQAAQYNEYNLYSRADVERKPTLIINASAALAVDQMSMERFFEGKMGKPVTSLVNDRALRREFDFHLRGLRFELTHFNPPRSCKIAGISDIGAKDHVFEHEGEQLNMTTYFERKYKIKIKNPSLPLLVRAPKSKNTLLPWDVVRLKRQCLKGAVADWIKKITADVMTMEPGRRYEYITNSCREQFGSNQVLDAFGLTVDKSAMMVHGEVIAPPVLKYTHPGGRAEATMTPSAGKWNLKDIAFCSTEAVANWGILDGAGVPEGAMKHFFGKMAEMANGKLNMKFGTAPRFVWQFHDESRLEHIKGTLQQYKTEQKELNILFIIIAERSQHWYKTVKSHFDDICSTQVLVQSRVPILNGNQKGVDGFIGNILSKVNMKCGGTNQSLFHSKIPIPALRHLLGSDNGGCVIGADLIHPSAAQQPGGDRRRQLPSLSAMCASVDKEALIYEHCWRGQVREIDTIRTFEEMFTSLMDRRCRNHQIDEWPSRIIYLRDGVSDSALSNMIASEVLEIVELYQKRGLSTPRILAMAVRKRHQTRFFPKSNDPRANAPPGTLIYDSLTLPMTLKNFYLLSHAGIKGTSHPCRYIVVKDDFRDTDTKLKTMNDKELLQYYAHMAYQLCHIYGRCQRTVSIPAPVYYAHLCADRARIHIDQITRKTFGLGVLSDDSGSVASGNAIPESTMLADEIIEKFITNMNRKLREVESSARPMCYA